MFFLPILVVDSGPPTLSSTGTLTIRICGCDSSGAIQSCNTTAFVMAASLSPGALIALLVCVLILVGESTQSHAPAPLACTLGPWTSFLVTPTGPQLPSPTRKGDPSDVRALQRRSHDKCSKDRAAPPPAPENANPT